MKTPHFSPVAVLALGLVVIPLTTDLNAEDKSQPAAAPTPTAEAAMFNCGRGSASYGPMEPFVLVLSNAPMSRAAARTRH